ncbi:TRAP transporter small permease subunit [Mesobacterium pallidum]|uniref:TRAP transporter small permease subunit n=1 Tax=Mesobacterium pallidum TaxID=2872037 RepID=UPI001EE1B714|nr:TRAP transporter small permease [Mesobacterium pallidum]
MTDTPRTPPARPDPALLAWIDRLALGLALVAGLALCLLALNVFVDVIGRAFFKTPLRGTLEMTAQWWMPALTLLAFAYTERRQDHIKVTILLDTLPARMRAWVEGCFGLIATALLVGLAWHAWHEAMDSFGYRETTSSLPPVAIWPVKFVAVIGVAALALQTAATSFRHFTGRLPGGAADTQGEGEAA